MSERPSGARARLLAAAVEHIAEHGVADLTLRGLAAGIGTSHRMLIYHFGSKEGLLVEVVRTVEERQRQALAETEAAGDQTLAELSRWLFRRLADPALSANERLFFEMYGQALQRRPGTTDLLDSAITPWLEQGVTLVERHGIHGEQARAHARLALAVGRGLLLDLLTTGDDAGVWAAAEYFISLWEDRADRPTAGSASREAGSTRPSTGA
jgi:AcrR family transcriptional regulator